MWRVPWRDSPPAPESAVPRYSLESIIAVLVVLWLLGNFVLPVVSGLIHLLLVLALVVLVVRLLQGRRAVR